MHPRDGAEAASKEDEFEALNTKLRQRGYGWLSTAAVRTELARMTQDRSGLPTFLARLPSASGKKPEVLEEEAWSCATQAAAADRESYRVAIELCSRAIDNYDALVYEHGCEEFLSHLATLHAIRGIALEEEWDSACAAWEAYMRCVCIRRHLVEATSRAELLGDLYRTQVYVLGNRVTREGMPLSQELKDDVKSGYYLLRAEAERTRRPGLSDAVIWAEQRFFDVLAPDNTFDALTRGRTLSEEGKHDQAVALYTDAIRGASADLAGHLWSAKGLALDDLKGNEKEEEALECFGRKLEIERRKAAFWYPRRVAQEFSVLRSSCGAARAGQDPCFSPMPLEDALNQGRKLAGLGYRFEALAVFNQGLATYPASAELLEETGWILAALDRGKEALACFDEIVRSEHGRAGAWYGRGWVLSHCLDRLEDAVEALDRAASLDEKHLNAFHEKGWTLYLLGRCDEAIASFDKGIELDRRVAGLWRDRSRALAALRRWDECLECCEQGLKLDSQFATLWQNKADALRCLGRPQESLGSYEEGLRLEPNNAGLWLGKAWALEGLGRWSELVGCCDSGLAIEPDNPSLLCTKGRALLNLERHQEAVECYKAALRRERNNGAGWHNMGWALHLLGRHEEALRCFDEAIGIDAKVAGVWRDKARALERFSALKKWSSAATEAWSWNRPAPTSGACTAGRSTASTRTACRASISVCAAIPTM